MSVPATPTSPVIVETPLTPLANISLQVTTPTATFLKLSNTASSPSTKSVPTPILSVVWIPIGSLRLKNPFAGPIGPSGP